MGVRMLKKSLFSWAIISILSLVISSCTMEVNGIRALDDDEGGTPKGLTSTVSSFSLDEILFDANGDLQGFSFIGLSDPGDFPATQTECNDADKITPAPSYTFFQLTDNGGVLSGKLVFTMVEDGSLIEPCFISTLFSGETLTISIKADEVKELSYENDLVNNIFTMLMISQDEEELSDTKDILEFSIDGQESVNIDKFERTIHVTMPFGYSLEGLVASFSTNSLADDPVTVGGIVQISGVTTNNFVEWEPVEYLVTAEDGTSQKYTVLVLLANGSNDRDFIEFSIMGQISSEITVDGMGVPTIYVLMPSGSSLDGLVAEFTTNSLAENAVHVGGVWQVSGVTENNYNEGIATAYWVVSQSELTKMYNVIVSIEEAPIITYKVTYTNDATGGWEEDHEEGSLIELPAPMSPDPAWAFVGWQDLATLTIYQTGDTMTVSGDITFYALWEEPEPEPGFAIGDVGPSGEGIIFYVDELDQFPWTYLESMNFDQGAPSGQAWSTVTDQSVNGTSTDIGTGLTNSQAIFTQHTGLGSSAASVCLSFVSMSGHDDWFLPSKEELALMYRNLHLQGRGNFIGEVPAMSNYWSSTESSSTNAYAIDFYNGMAVTMMKSAPITYIRCIRAF